MTTGKLQIGIVGCGKIAAKHMAGYARIPDVDILVTDISPDCREIAEENGATWCPSPEKMLADPKIQAIDICTPTSHHAPYALAALEAGKHVFCEKPLTDDAQKAREIMDAEEKYGKIVMLGHIFKFHPAFKMLKDVLDQGVLGEPHFGILRIGGCGSHQAWKHRKDSSGGVMYEMMVHVLDLALWYFGQPVKVDTYLHDTILKERVINSEAVQTDAEDICIARLGMDNGATVLCESDFVSTNYSNVVEVHGDNGSFFTSIISDIPTILFLKEDRGGHKAGRTAVTFPMENLFVNELGHFVDCIRNGNSPRCNTSQESLDLLKVVEAIR